MIDINRMDPYSKKQIIDFVNDNFQALLKSYSGGFLYKFEVVSEILHSRIFVDFIMVHSGRLKYMSPSKIVIVIENLLTGLKEMEVSVEGYDKELEENHICNNCKYQIINAGSTCDNSSVVVRNYPQVFCKGFSVKEFN